MLLDYQTWLKSKSKKPKDSPDIKTEAGYPAYYLTPDQLNAYINAISPWDLWMKPNTTPFSMDYPTTAMNVRAPWGMPQDKNTTALFATGSSPQFNMNWMNSPQEAQGVYVHELAHQKDLRTDPYRAWSFPNHGFITYGLTGDVLQREFPAMVAEENYRNALRR